MCVVRMPGVKHRLTLARLQILFNQVYTCSLRKYKVTSFDRLENSFYTDKPKAYVWEMCRCVIVRCLYVVLYCIVVTICYMLWGMLSDFWGEVFCILPEYRFNDFLLLY